MNDRSWCPAPSSLRTLSFLAILFFPTTAMAGFLTADPTYMGYRIPEYRWSHWTAFGDVSGNHAGWNSSFGSEFRDGVFSGLLGTDAHWGYDSDRLQHGWGFAMDARGSRSGSRNFNGDPFSTYEVDRSGEDLSQALSVVGSVRAYPWSAPVGFSARTLHFVELTQRFATEDARSIQTITKSISTAGSSIGRRAYTGDVTGWIGLGQVRDATPVHRAQVLEARLLATGALERGLSNGARNRLAALFATQVDVSNAHQRPNKYFWRELERVLREDGALVRGSFDAWDLFRILEPISVGSSVSRQTGFFVGPALTVRTSRRREVREESYSNIFYLADTVAATTSGSFERTDNFRSDDVFVSLQAEIHRPLGPRWQLDGFTSVGIQEAGEFPFVRNTLSLAWIISDRWVGILRGSQLSSAQGRSRHFSTWDVRLDGELVYFLEDAWAVRLTAQEGQFHGPRDFRRSGNYRLGVTYVLSGFFEVPGLVPAMRPTPPSP